MRTSNSGIQTFKSCRRLYQFKYVYGLEPVQTADALSRGTQYHDLVEGLLIGQSRFKDCDDPKIKAMATAFQMHIMPVLGGIGAAEEWFSYETKSGHLVVGRVDGITEDRIIIEHKTTSGSIEGDYFLKLDMDEQIPTYMLGMNSTHVIYTVCQVPTIRQKKNETDDEFYQRCVDWYSEDSIKKIACVHLFKNDEQLRKFAEEQDAVISEMENCKVFYRNPSHCNKWGRMCEFASVCMDYDPNKEYIQFKRRETYEQIREAEVREAGGE